MNLVERQWLVPVEKEVTEEGRCRFSEGELGECDWFIVRGFLAENKDGGYVDLDLWRGLDLGWEFDYCAWLTIKLSTHWFS